MTEPNEPTEATESTDETFIPTSTEAAPNIGHGDTEDLSTGDN